jgi:tellurite resistance protein TerC
METHLWFWIAFNAAVLAMLALDLFGFNRKAHVISIREAAISTAIWVFLSLAFNAVIWHVKGPEKAEEFLTGYLTEYSLSIDNVFVFALIFAHFKVPDSLQHRVLFWGVIGALAMRGTMIVFGVALIRAYSWLLYLFGLFLLLTGVRMLLQKQPGIDLERSRLLAFFRKVVPIASDYYGPRFFVQLEGRWILTPLALVLLLIEATDLIFAVDSIPAIFGITLDPFIVYTSNICAILGLRSLYFLLAHIIGRFTYLKTGLAFILSFIGVKMLIADFFHIPIVVSLAIVAGTLATAITVSVVATRRQAN